MTSKPRPPERVAAYIDGFNLYFGIRRYGRQHLWLDLEALMRSLLKPHQRLVAVRYFTAMIRNDPAAEQRQKIYLNALSAHSRLLEIREGRFQQKTKTCWSCHRQCTDYEEKESDVALAVSLVEDGVRGLFDTALLVSADSDMAPGIRALRRLVPSARVVAAMPPHRRSFGLTTVCDASFPISVTKVRQAQLPDIVTVAERSFRRPAHWN